MSLRTQPSPFRPLTLDQIGGAVVMRPFRSPTLEATGVAPDFRGNIPANTSLSTEQLATIGNRAALIENRFIRVWPRADGAPPVSIQSHSAAQRVPIAGAVRHKLPIGFGKWIVVEGVILGTKLSGEEADKIVAGGAPQAQAGQPAPMTGKRERKHRKRHTHRAAAPAAAPPQEPERDPAAPIGDPPAEE